jgi:hypothetical protein
LGDSILKKEAAELLGVSAGRVSHLIRDGVLQEVEGRRLSRAQVLEVKAKAAIRWQVEGVKSGRRKQAEPPTEPLEVGRRAVREAVAAMPASEIPPIQESRARHEHFRALITQLEHDRKTGDLLDRETTMATWFQFVRNARDSFLSIPSRIADEVSAMAGEVSRESRMEIANLISREITGVLEDLSRFDGVNRNLDE